MACGLPFLSDLKGDVQHGKKTKTPLQASLCLTCCICEEKNDILYNGNAELSIFYFSDSFTIQLFLQKQIPYFKIRGYPSSIRASVYFFSSICFNASWQRFSISVNFFARFNSNMTAGCCSSYGISIMSYRPLPLSRLDFFL